MGSCCSTFNFNACSALYATGNYGGCLQLCNQELFSHAGAYGTYYIHWLQYMCHRGLKNYQAAATVFMGHHLLRSDPTFKDYTNWLQSFQCDLSEMTYSEKLVKFFTTLATVEEIDAFSKCLSSRYLSESGFTICLIALQNNI